VNALLAVDIGNTNVTLGVFDLSDPAKPVLAHHWRMATLVTLRGLTELAGCKMESFRAALVSSVVPPLLPIWERVCGKLLGKPPLVVGPGIKTGMPVRYENPREVGADRIVNSVAAYELMGGPVIAVDFGTATTWDCVSEKGEYLGGAIFPGIVISMEALFERTSMLHRVELARPRSVIGRTTTQSIQSGLLFGYAGLVDSMVRRIKLELGEHARVIATGGLAQRIAAETETIERVEPYLTLEGLRLLFEKNRSQEKPHL
jgi:type III pantothenate kinase